MAVQGDNAAKIGAELHAIARPHLLPRRAQDVATLPALRTSRRDPAGAHRRRHPQRWAPRCIAWCHRAGRGAALGLRFPARSHRLGRWASSIRPQAPDRAPRPIRDYPPGGWSLWIPLSRRERARCLRRGTRLDVDFRRVGHGRGVLPERRTRPACRGGHWRRSAHGRHGLRGAEQRGRPRSALPRHSQRQRDVDRPERRRDVPLSRSRPHRSALPPRQGRACPHHRALTPGRAPRRAGQALEGLAQGVHLSRHDLGRARIHLHGPNRRTRHARARRCFAASDLRYRDPYSSTS